VSLTFEEIAIAFSNCNSDAKISFKDYLVNLYKSKEDYEKGFIVSDVNNYILTDIEKLVSKAVLNICAADNLIRKGYFSWGFVTSYYANFFLILCSRKEFYSWQFFNIIDWVGVNGCSPLQCKLIYEKYI
jgi:hypothetical protein